MNSRHNSRETVMAKLRSVPVRSDLPEVRPPTGLAEHTQADLSRQFSLALEASKGSVTKTSRDGLEHTLLRVIREYTPESVLLEDHERLPIGLRDQLVAAGVRAEKFVDAYEGMRQAVFAADVSVSFARCGIAQTGSLMITSAQRAPRLLSLASPVHICIVNEADIYPDFATALSGENLTAAMPTNMILVSGPSRTADIEFNISLGIHGPKTFIAVLVTS